MIGALANGTPRVETTASARNGDRDGDRGVDIASSDLEAAVLDREGAGWRVNATTSWSSSSASRVRSRPVGPLARNVRASWVLFLSMCARASALSGCLGRRERQHLRSSDIEDRVMGDSHAPVSQFAQVGPRPRTKADLPGINTSHRAGAIAAYRDR